MQIFGLLAWKSGIGHKFAFFSTNTKLAFLYKYFKLLILQKNLNVPFDKSGVKENLNNIEKQISLQRLVSWSKITPDFKYSYLYYSQKYDKMSKFEKSIGVKL